MALSANRVRCMRAFARAFTRSFWCSSNICVSFWRPMLSHSPTPTHNRPITHSYQAGYVNATGEQVAYVEESVCPIYLRNTRIPPYNCTMFFGVEVAYSNVNCSQWPCAVVRITVDVLGCCAWHRIYGLQYTHDELASEFSTHTSTPVHC